MKTRIVKLLLLMLMVSCTTSSRALIPPEIVSKGKQATALVEIGGGRGFGSAFCIDAAEGIFITNEHVAHGLDNSGSVTLILHSGEANQQRVKAVIVRTDKDLDLALLRIKEPKQLTALTLGTVYDGKTGAYLHDFVAGNGIRGLSDFCFGPDKRFYVASSNSREVKRFNSDTGEFIDNYLGPDVLGGEPIAMTFGQDGNLYVVTTANDVKRFNGKSGQFIDVFVSGNGLERPLFLIFH